MSKKIYSYKKRHNLHKRQILEVKLRDENSEIIYEKFVGVNDKKKVAELIWDLKNKGVNLDISDVIPDRQWW